MYIFGGVLLLILTGYLVLQTKEGQAWLHAQTEKIKEERFVAAMRHMYETHGMGRILFEFEHHAWSMTRPSEHEYLFTAPDKSGEVLLTLPQNKGERLRVVSRASKENKT